MWRFSDGLWKYRSSRPEVCNFKACNSIKKETLAQVFSCEFCKISKNVFTEHLRATDSGSIERLVTCGLRAHLQDYYCKKIRFFSSTWSVSFWGWNNALFSLRLYCSNKSANKFFLYKIKYWKNNGPFSVKPLIYRGVEIFQKTQQEQSRFFL